LVIEALVYGALVLVYLFLVLRLLADPLHRLFTDHLGWYALAGLALIVAQGAVLEFITSLLVNRIGLERLD
jgi:hypothetical protein